MGLRVWFFSLVLGAGPGRAELIGADPRSRVPGLSIIEGSPHRFARRVLLSAWPVLGDKWNDSRWHGFNHAGRGEEDAPMDRVEVYQRRAEECLAKALVSREEDLESAHSRSRTRWPTAHGIGS